MENVPTTILVVDDSDTTRAIIKRVIGMLDLPSVVILEASNGAIGLTHLASKHVDMVLADLNMPVMDGFEMISRMRARKDWRGIPVVVISAQPDPEKIDVLKRQGVTAYLPKPFTAESVRNIIFPLLTQPAVNAAEASAAPTTATFNMTLAEALSEALEKMAFITADFIPSSEWPEVPHGAQLIGVHFRGPDTLGSLSVAASPALGESIARTLGMTDPSAAEDALKELTNITCGLLLRMRPGGGVGFHLDPPCVHSSQERNLRSLFNSNDLVAFSVDGELIAAQVQTDGAFYGE